jgi:hypothetical protein
MLVMGDGESGYPCDDVVVNGQNHLAVDVNKSNLKVIKEILGDKFRMAKSSKT